MKNLKKDWGPGDDSAPEGCKVNEAEKFNSTWSYLHRAAPPPPSFVLSKYSKSEFHFLKTWFQAPSLNSAKHELYRDTSGVMHSLLPWNTVSLGLILTCGVYVYSCWQDTGQNLPWPLNVPVHSAVAKHVTAQLGKVTYSIYSGVASKGSKALISSPPPATMKLGLNSSITSPHKKDWTFQIT